MKQIVLYDDEKETEYEGYHIKWDYFQKIMEELIWDILKPEMQEDQEKDRT